MDCLSSGYIGQTCTDDQLGLMYWNATDQEYETRQMVSVKPGTNQGIDNPSLLAGLFNDDYDPTTGILNSKNPWPWIGGCLLLLVVLFFIFKK